MEFLSEPSSSINPPFIRLTISKRVHPVDDIVGVEELLATEGDNVKSHPIPDKDDMPECFSFCRS